MAASNNEVAGTLLSTFLMNLTPYLNAVFDVCILGELYELDSSDCTGLNDDYGHSIYVRGRRLQHCCCALNSLLCSSSLTDPARVSYSFSLFSYMYAVWRAPLYELIWPKKIPSSHWLGSASLKPDSPKNPVGEKGDIREKSTVFLSICPVQHRLPKKPRKLAFLHIEQTLGMIVIDQRNDGGSMRLSGWLHAKLASNRSSCSRNWYLVLCKVRRLI